MSLLAAASIFDSPFTDRFGRRRNAHKNSSGLGSKSEPMGKEEGWIIPWWIAQTAKSSSVISVTVESGTDKVLSSAPTRRSEGANHEQRTQRQHLPRCHWVPVLEDVAAAFARLEKARPAKKLKAARDRRQRRNG